MMVGFSEQEESVIRAAAQKNALSMEQKRAILKRVQEASAKLPTGQEGLKGATGGLVTRDLAEGVGGMVGGMVGGVTAAPSGPGAVAGSLAGGALGAAGGTLAFDSVENFLSGVGIIKPPVDTDTSAEASALRAGKAAQTDLAFAGGAMAAGRVLSTIGPTLSKFIGANTPEARQVMQEAENAGLFITVGGQKVPAVGAIDAAPGLKGGALRMWGKVIGGFPFISGPLRAQGAKKAGAVIDETSRTLNLLAPTSTTAADLGIDMVKAARGSIDEFRSLSAKLFTDFRSAAGALDKPDIIPASGVRQAVKDAMGALSSGRIDLGVDPKTGKSLILDREISPDLSRLAGLMENLPDRITVAQYESVMDRISRLFDESADLSGFEIKQVVQIKKAMEEAFLSPDLTKLSQEQAAEIAQLHKAANEFFAKGITKFQSPSAQKVARVDKNIFQVGPTKPGTLEEDALTDTMLKLKSPQAIRDLSKLVGKENMGKLARTKFERAWENAIVLDEVGGEVKGFDWTRIIRDFGLTKEFAQNREASKALFEEAGVSFERVEQLIKTASRIEVPKGVNQFLARRAALGGLGSAFAGATTASLVKDSLVASMGVTFLMRRFSSIISDPRKLKAMQRIVDDSVPTQQKRALLGRLIDLLDQEDAGVGQSPTARAQ